MKNVAIIGYGYVGKAMGLIFPDALIYDPYQEEVYDEENETTSYQHIGASHSSGYIYKKLDNKKEINEQCGLAIICVPTPPVGMKGEQRVEEDEKLFREVDLSMVKDALDWLKVDYVLIKSTIPPGTTDMLNDDYLNSYIAFSPEYIGESGYYTPPKYPDPIDPRKHDFLIVGGDTENVDAIFAYFKPKLGPAKIYHSCTAVEAECIKYAENTWGAMKVTFFNEWFEMCKVFGASFNNVREGLLLDSRVEPMHSTVFEEKRGFGGKCYPKDLIGIIRASEKAGYEPKFLKEVWETNKRMLKLNKK